MDGLDLKSDPIQPRVIILQTLMSPPEDTAPWRGVVRSRGWHPPTDVYEVDDVILVRVEIPGVKDEDFSIVLDGRILSVRGIRYDISERRAFHRMEIPFGEFISVIELPYSVNPDQIEADYTGGFLRIRMSRLNPTTIKVDE
jgi:HSP20 family protein